MNGKYSVPIPLAANAAGAIADLWMTMTLLGFPDDIRLEDHPNGVRILGHENDGHVRCP